MNILDEDGYPTKEVLEQLKDCDGWRAFEILKEGWWMADMGISYELKPEEKALIEPLEYGSPRKYMRLATLGWSGNESLIEAFEQNIWWFMTFRLHAYGGLYIFNIGLVSDRM